jgi:hypothetical protein
VCYIAAEALGTEVDDTDPRWDEVKRKEMHSQVIENDTYEVFSADSLGGRKALSSMWVCSAKADGRMKARFVPKGCVDNGLMSTIMRLGHLWPNL